MLKKLFGGKARKTSPKPEHIHDTMFLEGEYYSVYEMADNDFVMVNGRFGNSLGGSWKREQAILRTVAREYLLGVVHTTANAAIIELGGGSRKDSTR